MHNELSMMIFERSTCNSFEVIINIMTNSYFNCPILLNENLESVRLILNFLGLKVFKLKNSKGLLCKESFHIK